MTVGPRWYLPVLLFGLLAGGLAFASSRWIGWSGWAPATCLPDHCFCEAVGRGAVVQPANAWSSLAFALAGLAMAHGRTRPGRFSGTYRRLFGYALVTVALGSYFYHASLTFAGQICDMSGMYLLITFALVYGMARRGWIGSGVAVGGYVVSNAGLLAFQTAYPELRRYMFALLVLGLSGMELRHREGAGSTDTKWLWRGIAAMGAAFLIWVLDITKLVCSPSSWLQGHALWHVLGAVSGWCLFRYYASEAGCLNARFSSQP